MTTMRERLIAAAAGELHEYARGSDGPSTGYCAERLLDAILAELREPDVGMLNAAAIEAKRIVVEVDPSEGPLTDDEAEHAKRHSARILAAMIESIGSEKP